MSDITFENYGTYATHFQDTTLASARYSIQKESERLILKDIVTKLSISPTDRYLDIGCGTGLVLIPMSFIVAHATGVDHANCLKRIQERDTAPNIELIPGNFLDLPLKESSFDKIVIYSVLHYLGEKKVLPFIKKATNLLSPGGKLLLGDIPNITLKKRFLGSEQGKKFQQEWEKQQNDFNGETDFEKLCPCPEDPDLACFDDERVLSLTRTIREMGCHAYIVPQDGTLPFGHTREDILVEKPC